MYLEIEARNVKAGDRFPAEEETVTALSDATVQNQWHGQQTAVIRIKGQYDGHDQSHLRAWRPNHLLIVDRADATIVRLALAGQLKAKELS